MQDRYVRIRKPEGGRLSPFITLAVTPYMLPYEKMEIIIRRHPAILVGLCALLVSACTAASLVTALTGSGAYVLIAIWGICGVILAYLSFRIFEWLWAFIVMTDARLILITGVIKRNAATVPLREIHDMEFRRSRLGRILGYGKYTLYPSVNGRRMPDMNYMPYPDRLYLEMCSIIFSDSIVDG